MTDPASCPSWVNCALCLRAELEAAEAKLEAAERQHEALKALVEKWREHARRVRPLESAALTAEKRASIQEWMWYTNRAKELASLLAERGQETIKT